MQKGTHNLRHMQLTPGITRKFRFAERSLSKKNLTINEIHLVSKYQMCTLDPGCNIHKLSHLIKYLYSKSLTRAMNLNVLIDINCGFQKIIDINHKYAFLVHHAMEFFSVLVLSFLSACTAHVENSLDKCLHVANLALL